MIEKLYHYTTPEGLIGIITNRCLWATGIFYLNDSEEFMRGVQIARNIIDNLENKSQGDEKERIERFQDDLALIGPSHNISAFVSSFSEASDQLSQWRAYCYGGGFAIGFPKEKLREAVGKQYFKLEKCIYDNDQHEENIKEVIVRVAEPWIKNPDQFRRKQPTASDRDIGCGISNTLIWELYSVCSVLKNASFIEESEWRLVSETRNDWHTKIEFRPRKGLVIPYVKIALPEFKDTDFWRHVEVVIGPSLYPEESRASVYKLFRKMSGFALPIKHTKSTFREL